MFSLYELQIKIAGIVLVFAIMGFAYYQVFVVPQSKIEKLQAEVIESKELPKKIINKINKNDANRTQEEINNVKTKTTIIYDNGVLVF